MTNRHLLLLFGAILWFGGIFWLAARGVFVTGPDEPPLRLALAFVMPILLFLIALFLLPGWGARTVSISPVFLIPRNGWQFIGWGFFMGDGEGLPPGGSPWPAGL